MQGTLCAPPRPIRRVQASTHRAAPSFPIYEVSPDRHHFLRIASSEVYSIWVHQVGKRTLPCYGESGCECEPGLPREREQHWLFVRAGDSRQLRLVRLTNGLVYQNVPQLKQPGLDLTGFTLELWREHASKLDSPMLGKLTEVNAGVMHAGELPDIAWAVSRMLTAPDRLAPFHQKGEDLATVIKRVTGVRAPDPESKRVQFIADWVREYQAQRRNRDQTNAALKTAGTSLEALGM